MPLPSGAGSIASNGGGSYSALGRSGSDRSSTGSRDRRRQNGGNSTDLAVAGVGVNNQGKQDVPL